MCKRRSNNASWSYNPTYIYNIYKVNNINNKSTRSYDVYNDEEGNIHSCIYETSIKTHTKAQTLTNCIIPLKTDTKYIWHT